MGSERKQKNRFKRTGISPWVSVLAIAFVAVAVGVILFMTGTATFDMLSDKSTGQPAVSEVQGGPADNQQGNAASDTSGASAAGDAANDGSEVIGDEDVPMASGIDSPGDTHSMGLGMRWIIALAAVIVVVAGVLRFKRVNGSIGKMRGKFR